MTRTITRALALVAFVTLLTAPAATAQYWSPAERQADRAPAHTFTDAEIAAYAATYVAIEAARAEFATQRQRTRDEAASEELLQRFQDTYAEIMDASEIDAERYNEITMATQSNQRLNSQVLARIQRERRAASRR